MALKGNSLRPGILPRLASNMAVSSKRSSGDDRGAVQGNAEKLAVSWFLNYRSIGASELGEIATELMERGTNWNPFDNFGIVQLHDGKLRRISGDELQSMAKGVQAAADEIANQQARGELPAVVPQEPY